MGGGIWMGGMQQHEPPLPRTPRKDVALYGRIKDLEHQVGRLSLLNQALWELLRDKLNLSDSDLEAVIREVDLRDGVEDGAITDVAVQCPTCGRISNSKHYKCLYCGQAFQRPIMG